MACKQSGFKSYRPLVGPIETQGSCTVQALQLNLRELTRVIHQMCAAISQFCFKGVRVNPLILSLFSWSNFNEVLLCMLGINCIKLIFGYLYYSPNNFPKIYKKLGGQLEIRLSVYIYLFIYWNQLFYTLFFSLISLCWYSVFNLLQRKSRLVNRHT